MVMDGALDSFEPLEENNVPERRTDTWDVMNELKKSEVWPRTSRGGVGGTFA